MRVLLLLALLNISFCFSQDFRYGKVSKEELAEVKHPIEADADAAILFREESTRFEYDQDRGFYILTEIFERVKIYNAEGYDRATKIIGVYQGSQAKEEVNGIKGVTYNLRDGKIDETKLRKDGIFEEERSKYYEVVKFTMPDIQEGCVIEYKYFLKSPFISNINEISLQEDIPLNKAEVKFKVPEYFGLNKYQKGWLPIKIDQSREERSVSYTYTQMNRGFGQALPERGRNKLTFLENIYSISVQNVPALKEEVYSGNMENYKSGLKFELAYTKYPNEPIKPISTTWDDVSKNIYDSESFGGELSSSRYFDDDIDTLLADNTGVKEKIAAVFEFVKNKMTWNKYMGMYSDEGLREAYKKGSGNAADINLMLVAMLRYAGIEANPVVLSTKDNGIPLFPTRNGFNYVIAGAEFNGEIMLMDATNKLGEINLLEEELLNWNGRLIEESGASKWVSLYPTKHAVQTSILNVNIDEGLFAIGGVKSRLSGHKALNYRFTMGSLDDDGKRKKLEEIYNKAEIDNIELQNLNTPYKPLTVNYEFESLDGVEEIEGKLYIKPLFHFVTEENPFKAEERKYPIDYSYPRKERYIISIAIPEGYKAEYIPESTAISLKEGLGSFKYQINQIGEAINVSLEMAINSSFISPDYYLDLKKFYDIVIAKESEKIILTRI